MLEEIQTSCVTWPGSRSLSQPPDALHQIVKAREAPVSAVGQNSLRIHEETRESGGKDGERSPYWERHTQLCFEPLYNTDFTTPICEH